MISMYEAKSSEATSAIMHNPASATLIILSVIFLFAPLLMWFVRNWLRIVHKRDIPFINRILWPSIGIGIFLFVLFITLAIYAV